MKAIVQDTYGTADVLKLEDIDRPVAGNGEVLLRVHAASVFIGDWHVMAGVPYLIRMVSGLRAPKARVRGQDVAGSVEEVGKDVRQFQLGDEVFGACDGSFAEYATAQPDKLARKPANLTFDQAATVPITGSTALQGLRDVGRLQPGQKVLIIGAAGGVGSFAVQIAKAYGADVTGVCSTMQLDLVRSLGADRVIDYSREDFAATGERYDLILDIAGARPVPHLRQALAARGTLVLVGAEGGGRWLGHMSRQLGAQMRSPFASQSLVAFIAKPTAARLLVLKELIEDGKVKPVMDKMYPLSEVPEAMRHLEGGHGRGKVVITV